MTIEEQKKAVRSGYDMDIIPSDLATYGNEAKKILQDLQSRNERMFLMTFLVLNTANSKQQLGNNVFQASSIAQKYNCQLTRLDFQQEEGLMLSLIHILEKRGIQTNIGNLNRDIKAANSLMQSIRQMVRHLKGWIADLKEKKATLLEALQEAKEPTLPEMLGQYLDLRREERTGWTRKGQLKGTCLLYTSRWR